MPHPAFHLPIHPLPPLRTRSPTNPPTPQCITTTTRTPTLPLPTTPPRHPRLPYLGCILELLQNSEHNIHLSKKYGPIYISDIFGRDYYYLTNPSHLRQLLRDSKTFVSRGSIQSQMLELFGENVVLAVDGDLHRRKRGVLMTAMMPGVLPLYWKVVRGVCEEFCGRFCKVGKMDGDERVDEEGRWVWGGEEMRNFAFLSVVRLTLGSDFGNGVCVGDMQRLFRDLSKGIVSPVLPCGLGPYGKAMRAKKALREVIGEVVRGKMEREGRVIEELKRVGGNEKGIRRVAVELLKEGKLDAVSIILAQLDWECEGFVDEAVEAVQILWFAGSETTAATARTLLYELSRQEGLLRDLVEEQDGLRRKYGEMTFKQLDEMVLLDGAIREVLRLRNPVSALVRQVVKDVEIAGYEIPKGSLIAADLKTAMVDERDYPDPFKFDPTRYAKGSGNVNLLSFGSGPHGCIGAVMAIMELKTMFATLLRDYTITFPPNEPQGFQSVPFVQPKSKIPFRTQRRVHND